MSLNSYLVTDEIRPLPGSGWTSKNAANSPDSIAKYKEKLNIPRGQKGYIDPAEFKLKDGFDKDALMNIEPKRSCVVSKPECVQYNYVIPETYLKEGIKNAKIENQILENELEELEAQHGDLKQQHDDLNTSHGALQRQHDDLNTSHGELQRQNSQSHQQHDELQQQQLELQTRLDTAISELEQSRTENREIVPLRVERTELNKILRNQKQQSKNIKAELDTTMDVLKDIEDGKNLEIDILNERMRGLESLLIESQGLLTQDVNHFLNSDMLVAPTTNFRKVGGTRHKKPRKRTQRRRITRRLRSRKIPRKCFSLRKREK